MLYWTDLHLERDTDDRHIAQAIATSFGVPVQSVAVADVSENAAAAWARPGLKVFVQRDNIDRHGEEFPVTLMITLRQDETIPKPVEKVRILGKKLGIAFITDVETEGDVWRLVMPDGEDRLILNQPAGDERGEFVLAPDDRSTLNHHRPVVV